MQTLELCNIDQLIHIYNENMKKDFPPDEMKPLAMIIQMVEDERYEPYQLIEDGERVGYAFLVRDGNDYMVDYLATTPGKRNSGRGAALIELLRQKMWDADSVIGEVEDPRYIDDPEDAKMAERRLGFYHRNGCPDTGATAICFGVHFLLHEIEMQKRHTAKETSAIYERIYRYMLPPDMFKEHMVI